MLPPLPRLLGGDLPMLRRRYLRIDLSLKDAHKWFLNINGDLIVLWELVHLLSVRLQVEVRYQLRFKRDIWCLLRPLWRLIVFDDLAGHIDGCGVRLSLIAFHISVDWILMRDVELTCYAAVV